MTTKFLNLRFLGLTAVAALAAAPLSAAAAGVTPGAPYSQQRAALLAAGWTPDAGYGLKLANGKPFHRFPEVLCGMEVCRAKWRDPSGAAHAIMLQRGAPNEEYRVTREE